MLRVLLMARLANGGFCQKWLSGVATILIGRASPERAAARQVVVE
jgi:hypothetical protein